MLIHKQTMGVLDYIWTGHYRDTPDGGRIPVMRQVRLTDFPELNPDEWWELPENHPLAMRILRQYPWLTPVVGAEGELLDVKSSIEEEKKRQEQERKQCLEKEAKSRGYQKAGRLRQLGLFSFLQETKEGIPK